MQRRDFAKTCMLGLLAPFAKLSQAAEPKIKAVPREAFHSEEALKKWLASLPSHGSVEPVPSEGCLNDPYKFWHQDLNWVPPTPKRTTYPMERWSLRVERTKNSGSFAMLDITFDCARKRKEYMAHHLDYSRPAYPGQPLPDIGGDFVPGNIFDLATMLRTHPSSVCATEMEDFLRDEEADLLSFRPNLPGRNQVIALKDCTFSQVAHTEKEGGAAGPFPNCPMVSGGQAYSFWTYTYHDGIHEMWDERSWHLVVNIDYRNDLHEHFSLCPIHPIIEHGSTWLNIQEVATYWEGQHLNKPIVSCGTKKTLVPWKMERHYVAEEIGVKDDEIFIQYPDDGMRYILPFNLDNVWEYEIRYGTPSYFS